jgi:hypothetical protein
MDHEMEFLKKIFLCLIFSIPICLSANSNLVEKPTTNLKSKPPIRVNVSSDSALIYDQPDFDAVVIREIAKGELISISHRSFGPFRRVRLSDGAMGYIADSDFILNPSKNSTIQKRTTPDGPLKPQDEMTDDEVSQQEDVDGVNKAKKKRSKNSEKKLEKKIKKPSFSQTRFRGPQLSSIRYSEDTMGQKATESVLFYGYRWTGPDLITDGGLQTDWTFLFHLGAPNYYKEATGYEGSGFLIVTDVQWLNVNVVSPRTMSFFGFGPMARINSYSLELKNGSSSKGYSAQDMVLGVSFSAGIAQKFNSFALRGDAKYYWERLQYWGIGVAAQFEF